MLRSLLWTGLLAVLTAGCGGGERWVTIPLMGCEELEKAQEDAENFPTMMNEHVGPSTCREAGGLQYADDVRCEDNQVQVLCEEA